MTTEQKLQAIIEAQVKGGHESYARFVEELPLGSCHVTDRGRVFAVQHTRDWHILEILLDPQGLRAIAKLFVKKDYFDRLSSGFAHEILDTWLSSNGDAAKTIDTAFSLLPRV